MEAKDTVMNDDTKRQFRMITKEVRLLLPEDCSDWDIDNMLLTQAEISFKAGRKTQLEENLKELISADGAEDLKTLEKQVTNLLYSWQAKLKEWQGDEED